MITAYLYPKCGTCRNAKKWLEEHNIPFHEINIYEQPPSVEELREFWQKSGLPLKKFFNTSGIQYKELQLKDRLPNMTEEEQLKLLASDGRLIKRPLLTDGNKVTVGFNVEQFEQEWNS